MNPPQPPNLVTFRLSKIVDDLLHGLDYVEISEENAQLILLSCRNLHTCHVQLISHENLDLYGRPITKPRLWSFASWQSCTERWLRQRKYSDDARDARNIFDANVRLVERAIQRLCPMPPDMAHCLARIALQHYPDCIPQLGVRKLITNVEEIP